jgi:hypothetical protein
MKETKEAGSISKFKSFNASTFSSPFAYTFDKLFAVTKLIGLTLQNFWGITGFISLAMLRALRRAFS